MAGLELEFLKIMIVINQTFMLFLKISFVLLTKNLDQALLIHAKEMAIQKIKEVVMRIRNSMPRTFLSLIATVIHHVIHVGMPIWYSIYTPQIMMIVQIVLMDRKLIQIMMMMEQELVKLKLLVKRKVKRKVKLLLKLMKRKQNKKKVIKMALKYLLSYYVYFQFVVFLYILLMIKVKGIKGNQKFNNYEHSNLINNKNNRIYMLRSQFYKVMNNIL